ncbi:hypothetical protein K445DRAFT_19779 [Daldinia sp. EC12]|nr:hypothetical protein K445DRAFT_19779 [Daldinia sp. EC12]
MDSDMGDLGLQMERFDFQTGNDDFRMEDFDPQDEDFDFDVGDFDFSMEAMNLEMQNINYPMDDIDQLLDDFFGYNLDPGSKPDNQSRQDEKIEQKPEGDANTPSSPDSQAFVNHYEWTNNNLPIGVSFNSDIPATTPGFMQGWTFEPENPENENQVIFMNSRGTGYRVEMVAAANDTGNKPEVRHSSRHKIAPRVPFPNKRPAWAMLATDFKNVSTIPNDVSLWCPCCTRTLPHSSFKRTPRNLTPVETCMDCRKRQMIPLKEMVICWSSPSDYQGCGRLLPRANFSGIYNHQTFTGILCQDCRAFGPDRARFEGRYTEARP